MPIYAVKWARPIALEQGMTSVSHSITNPYEEIFHEFEWGNPVAQAGESKLYAARLAGGDAMFFLLPLPAELFSTPEDLAQFVKRMEDMQQIRHPCLLHVIGVASRGGCACIAYEWFPGGSLDSMMRSKIPVNQSISMTASVADALHALHQAGICHLDVNPGWILMDSQGGAKLYGAGITQFLYASNDLFLKSHMRRPAHLRLYLAPEQLDPDLTESFLTDVYSLAAVIYHLLVGSPPGGLTILPSSRGEVGRRTDDVVLRSLHRDPSLRYPTAQAFGIDVRKVGGAIENSHWTNLQRHASGMGNLAKRMTRRLVNLTWKDWLAIGTALVMLVVGAWFVFKHLLEAQTKTTKELVASMGEEIVSKEQKEASLAVVASLVHKAVASGWDGSKMDEIEEASRGAVIAGNRGEVVDLAKVCIAKAPPGTPDARRVAELVRLLEDGGEAQFRAMQRAEAARLAGDAAGEYNQLALAAAFLPTQPDLPAQMTAKDRGKQQLGGTRLSSKHDPVPTLLTALESLTGGPDGAPAGFMIWSHGLEVHVDLANNPGLTDITALRGHPITHLDLDHTAVSDLSALTGMPLKVLHVDGTKVMDLSPVEQCPLRVLTAEGTQISQLGRIPSSASLICYRLGMAGGELNSAIGSARSYDDWINSIGQRFQPVLGVPGILVSEWETRVRDYTQFAKASNRPVQAEMLMMSETGKWESVVKSWDAPPFEQTLDHPVVGVSIEDAKAFCKWLTETEHAANILPLSAHYRLPTTAEWTRATGLALEDESKKTWELPKYCWGDDWPPNGLVGNFPVELATFGEGAKKPQNDNHQFTSPVGMFRSEALLRDVGGNVREWTGTSEDAGFIVRDAAWGLEKGDLQSALELSHESVVPANSRWANLGFRIILDLTSAP